MKARFSKINYRSLFENMLDGFVYFQMIFDSDKQPVDFVFLEVNKNYERLTGMKNVKGKKMSDLISDIRESNQEMFEVYARVSLTGAPESVEIYFKPTERWFLVSVYPTKKNFFVAVFQDITGRKESEQDFKNSKIAAQNVLEDLEDEKKRLAEAKAKDEAMLASIGDGVIIVDLAGRITLMNKSAEDLLGWKNTESVGKLLFDVVPIEDNKGMVISAENHPMELALSNGMVSQEENTVFLNKNNAGMYYYVRKDKTKFPVSMNFSRVMLEGTVVGAIEVFRDITKEIEIDHAKNEFVSLASHQLRTPLTTINWYSEMLLQGEIQKNSAKQKEYLLKIHMSSERMVVLVNTLLNVSRLELGTLVIELAPVSVTKLLQEVIDEQKPQIDEKKLIVKSHFEREIPVFQTDVNLLRMVFQNLLSNAVKYTSSSGHINISVSMPEETRLLITFSDTGYGIPKKDQDKIFTKMFRADNIKEKVTEGTGLGLYMAKSLLVVLGGTIRFESEENKGTDFYITLPFSKIKNTIEEIHSL